MLLDKLTSLVPLLFVRPVEGLDLPCNFSEDRSRLAAHGSGVEVCAPDCVESVLLRGMQSIWLRASVLHHRIKRAGSLKKNIRGPCKGFPEADAALAGRYKWLRRLINRESLKHSLWSAMLSHAVRMVCLHDCCTV